MRKFLTVEPGENWEPIERVFTEAEILALYWDHWRSGMVRLHGPDDPRMTEANCIDDFVVVHWAVELKSPVIGGLK